MPLLALNSVRALSTADAGRASPHILRPPSSQQYSFFLGASCCCACTGEAAATTSSAIAIGAYDLVISTSFRKHAPVGLARSKDRASATGRSTRLLRAVTAEGGTVREQALAMCDQFGISAGKIQQIGQ